MLLYALVIEGEVVEERSLAAEPAGIKLGADGLPILRPLEIERPDLARCQNYASHHYVIEDERVVKVFVPAPVDLNALKRERVAEVSAALDEALGAGFEWPTGSGNRFQFRDGDRANIVGAASMAMLAIQGAGSWPADFAWIATDNSRVSITTPAAMLDFARAAFAAMQRVVFVARDHKDAILDAVSADEVEAHSIAEGW